MLEAMKFSCLSEFIDRNQRLFVLTGAGCSTESGIPDYRDANGDWKRVRPVMFQDFIKDPATRGRYWARSLVGWPSFRGAPPNVAHRALARLEQEGRVTLLVTQNVDRLHQTAGSRRVLDLHGRLDLVRCLSCDNRLPRAVIQDELLQRNPAWEQVKAPDRPDGDADLEYADVSAFEVPTCAECNGVLKPDVVFFGERVPTERVEAAMAGLKEADAMLVVGSSLMLYSGYRFAQAMALAGKPIAAVNLGCTRADDLLALKVTERCTRALAFVLEDHKRVRRQMTDGAEMNYSVAAKSPPSAL